MVTMLLLLERYPWRHQLQMLRCLVPASMRRMMTMVESGTTPKLPDQRLEINAKHPIIKHLATLRESDADFAAVVARQLFSNALISAGLLDDPRTMLADLNQILEHAAKGK